MRELTYADYFQKIGKEELFKLGFVLSRGPDVGKQFNSSDVVYKNRQDLFLRLYFSPTDGGCAGIQFGRTWRYEGNTEPNSFPPHNWIGYSNSYFSFANMYGQDFPEERIAVGSKNIINYETRDDWRKNEIKDVCESILDNLIATLPTILSQLNESDLLKIESHGRVSVSAILERMNGSLVQKGKEEICLAGSKVQWDQKISSLI